MIRRQPSSCAIEEETTGWYPIDEKMGMGKCYGYSPLMTYLLSFYGAQIPYTGGPDSLRPSAWIWHQATAVERNTEETGKRIAHHPLRIIPYQKQSESCRFMIVEVDGTMSPQIHEKQGITSRDSLKQPTEYKECNIISIYNKIQTEHKPTAGPERAMDLDLVLSTMQARQV